MFFVITMPVKCPTCEKDFELTQEDSCFVIAGTCPNCGSFVTHTTSMTVAYKLSAIPKENLPPSPS